MPHRRAAIRDALLAASRTIQSPHFLKTDAADLRWLFAAYDAAYFGNALAAGANREGGPVTLEWSNRLRSAGGVTRRVRRGAIIRYSIAVSRPLILDNFRDGRPLLVVGLPCPDRLDALMRIVEHELLHLHEFLTYGRSDCARPRFKRLAADHFGHAAHRHRLVTPRERVLAGTAIRPGTIVTFTHDGRPLVGRVNRITQRASVLVESANGTRYTDGKRYEKFYVPVTRLNAV